MRIPLPDAAATDALGRRLGLALARGPAGAVVALRGELGAGKTALARAAIRALGHAGPVVSPTYTLVEPYDLAGRRLLHLDLYRLSDPEELEYLGLRDSDPARDWWLVEWPERGEGFLPPADIEISLAYAGAGRIATVTGPSERGTALAAAVAEG